MIVDALRRGRAEVVLGVQARLLALAHDLFPGTTTRLLGLFNRLLPRSDGWRGLVPGGEPAAAQARSLVVRLIERDGRRANQLNGRGSVTRSP